MDLVSKVFEYFKLISKIPRESKNEKGIINFIQKKAIEKGLFYKQDSAGNLVVKIPAGENEKLRTSVALQSHVDMVCQKLPHIKHDFLFSPIVPIEKDGWLVANGTTLGADNGIGVAMMLALFDIDVRQRKHPELELLFTVEEEVGLVGVSNLSGDMLSSKRLINLDSESEGCFIAGCAGGMDCDLTLENIKFCQYNNISPIQIAISGLKGGHSGLDIHKPGLNAIKTLALMIYNACKGADFYISSFDGGTLRNAIARDAVAVVGVDKEIFLEVKKNIETIKGEFLKEFAGIEENISIEVNFLDSKEFFAINASDSLKIVELINSLNSKIVSLEQVFPLVVKSSSNVAKIKVEPSKVSILTSHRGLSAFAMAEALTPAVCSAELAGFSYSIGTNYPWWNYEPNSALCVKCRQIYEKVTGKKSEVLSVHAGLECGVLKNIFPDMQMVSMGPDIENPHSPYERVNVESVKRVFKTLISILDEI